MEAEIGLLGSMLLSPREIIGEVVTLIGSESDYFYQHAHKVTYQQLFDMWTKNEAVDPVTLMQRLKDNNRLDEVGGPIYVTNLFTSVPTTGNYRYYFQIVREKFQLRRIIELATEMVSQAYDQSITPEEILATYSEQVVRGLDTGFEFVPHKLALQQGFELLDKIYNAQGGIIGIPTGFARLDRYTRGMKEGEFWVLGGPPSEGKTALAMNVGLNVAESGIPVGMLSMEQTAKAISLRSMAIGAKVEIFAFPYSKDTFTRLTAEHAKQSPWPLFYDDRSGLTLSRARASIRRMVHRHKIKLALVDYLQLMEAETKKETITEAMTAVSKGLKNLAKELNITILALSQLNRDSRKSDRRPQLHDLKQSGQIEQDGDIVILLAGPANEKDFTSYEPQDRPSEHELKQIVVVDLAKNRDGKTGALPFVFRREWFRFDEWNPPRKIREPNPQQPDP